MSPDFVEVTDLVRRTHIVRSVNTLAQPSAVAALSNNGLFIKANRVMVRDAKGVCRGMFNEFGLEYICIEGNHPDGAAVGGGGVAPCFAGGPG